MKKIFLSLLVFCCLSPSAFATISKTSPTYATQLLKKFKDLYDENTVGAFMTNDCRDPGVQCNTSGDCCGSSVCTSGYCTDPGDNNIGPGGHCNSSGECAGSSTCVGGFCSDPGDNNIPPGGRCNTSGECQGSSICNSGYCSDPGNNNIPPGGHCNSSGECAGSSTCNNGFCS